MAISFVRKDSTVTIAEASIYTPTAGATGIVFAGTATNIDSTARSDHTITITRQESGSPASRFAKFKSLPIAFGGTSPIPKIIVQPGDVLYVSADTDGVVQVMLEIVEIS